MPDWMSRERKDLIGSYGAEIVPVSHEQGGFLGSIRMAEEFAASIEMFPAHASFRTMPTPKRTKRPLGRRFGCNWKVPGRVPDAFVAGVGTGGTVMEWDDFSDARMPRSTSIPSNFRSLRRSPWGTR